MPDKTIIIPNGLAEPVGYNHAIAVKGGTTVYLAGQTATNAEGEYVARGDIVGQFERALGNLETAVLASGGAKPLPSKVGNTPPVSPSLLPEKSRPGFEDSPKSDPKAPAPDTGRDNLPPKVSRP